MSEDVIEFPQKSGPGVGHRTRKNAGAKSPVTADKFNSDDEVVNLTALKTRLSQMLAKNDISERDFKAISVEYRAVMIELKEARDRAESAKLGRRGGLTAVGGRSFDGDI